MEDIRAYLTLKKDHPLTVVYVANTTICTLFSHQNNIETTAYFMVNHLLSADQCSPTRCRRTVHGHAVYQQAASQFSRVSTAVIWLKVHIIYTCHSHLYALLHVCHKISTSYFKFSYNIMYRDHF